MVKLRGFEPVEQGLDQDLSWLFFFEILADKVEKLLVGNFVLYGPELRFVAF